MSLARLCKFVRGPGKGELTPLFVFFQGEDKAPGCGDSAAEDSATPWFWKAVSTQGGLQGAARTDTHQLLKPF